MHSFAVVFLTAILTLTSVASAEDVISSRYYRERKVFIDFELPKDVPLSASREERAMMKSLFVRLHNRILALVIRTEHIEGVLERKLSIRESVVDNDSDPWIKLDAAKSKIVIARLKLEEASSDFEKIFLTSNNREAFEGVRRLIQYDVIANLQIAHTFLVEISLRLQETPQ